MMENFKLKVFRVVADTLNFRRAAEELHLTQPAITSQIKSLEESLGIALFDRVSRDINVTPAGTTLLQYVRHIEGASKKRTAVPMPLLSMFCRRFFCHCSKNGRSFVFTLWAVVRTRSFMH